MINSMKSLVLSAVCAAWLTGGTAGAYAENSVRFGDAAANAGDTVYVDVTIENDVVIAGAAIPFRWSSTDLTLDTVRFVTGRFRGDMITRGGASPAPQTGALLLFAGYPRPGWIEPGSGVVARIRFVVSPGATAQWVTVDSIYEDAGGGNVTVAQFSDFTGSRIIKPVVYSGVVTIGDPVGQATLTVVPDRLEFHALRRGSAPPVQTLRIRSIGGPPVSWSAGISEAWMMASPLFGQAPGDIQVGIVSEGLEAGSYSDTLIISAPAAANTPLRVPVTVVVEYATSLVVTPSELDFRAIAGAEPPSSKSLTVTALNGVSISWSASWSTDWLSAYPPAGTGQRVVSVRAESQLLTPGTYRDTIVVLAGEASNSPQLVPVTLFVDTTAAIQPRYALGQNQPNPFSTYRDPITSVAYSVDREDHVEITIHDVLGRPVRHLVSTRVSPGTHSATWDGRDDWGKTVASGHYFCRLRTSAGSETRQMVVIK